MSLIEALIISIVQGISEFIPISSSGHIAIIKNLLNIKMDRSFDLFCHLGCSLAAIIFLREKIKEIIKNKKALFLISLTIIPLIPIYLIIKNISLNISPNLLSISFIITAILLATAAIIPTKQKNSSNRKIKDVLFIGLMQAVALIPGISRSGSTISGARFMGWNIKDSIYFSFIIMIPAVLGGSLLETFSLVKKGEMVFDRSLILGFFISFLFGFLTIRLIFLLKNRKNLLYFSLYCLLVGIITKIILK